MVEYGANPSEQNFFQARYAMRHWWTGGIKCQNPQRGVWGGPPDGSDPGQTIGASKIAFAPRGRMQLGAVIGRDLWEIGFKKDKAAPAAPAPAPKGGFAQPPNKPGAVKAMGLGALGALMLLGLGALFYKRKQKQS